MGDVLGRLWMVFLWVPWGGRGRGREHTRSRASGSFVDGRHTFSNSPIFMLYNIRDATTMFELHRRRQVETWSRDRWGCCNVAIGEEYQEKRTGCDSPLVTTRNVPNFSCFQFELEHNLTFATVGLNSENPTVQTVGFSVYHVSRPSGTVSPILDALDRHV